MARLYADENFPLPVVEELRLLGHDVVTLQERGHGDEAVADSEVLALATAEGRAVLTLNRRDFLRLHRDGGGDAGMIVCTIDPDFPRQAARIHDALAALSDLRGLVIRVNRPA